VIGQNIIDGAVFAQLLKPVACSGQGLQAASFWMYLFV